MMKIINTTRTSETMYLKHTECYSRGSKQVKSSSRGTVESNAPLDVPIVMPEHADGSSKSKDAEDTAKIEQDWCWTGAGVHAHIDEASWHTGETKTPSRTPIDHCQQLVEMDSDRKPTNDRM